MALSTSPVFKGFRGSVNRQLLFKQCGGKTIVTRFPDRSRVVYSENQKREQRRFADAVAFARIVIADKRLFREYSLKASMFNFRSAWNAAIAEYMNKGPLRPKPKKIRFEKAVITAAMGENISVKLYRLEYPRKILTFKSVKEKPSCKRDFSRNGRKGFTQSSSFSPLKKHPPPAGDTSMCASIV